MTPKVAGLTEVDAGSGLLDSGLVLGPPGACASQRRPVDNRRRPGRSSHLLGWGFGQ